MSKQEIIKKELEFRYLKFFRETEVGREYLAPFCLLDKYSEEPDFLFKNSLTNEIIGIEIVNIIVESTKQQTTAKLNNIVRNVCLKLNDYTKTKYCVFLSCNDGNYDLIPIKSSEWVDKIFQIIINDKELKIGEVKKIDFNLCNNDVLHLAYSINESLYNFPGVPDGNIIIQNPFNLLEKVINKKNEKYEQYLKKCDKCSLVIVSDNMAGHSSFIEFDESLDNYRFNSKFSDIFLYEFGAKIHSNTRKINIFSN